MIVIKKIKFLVFSSILLFISACGSDPHAFLDNSDRRLAQFLDDFDEYFTGKM